MNTDKTCRHVLAAICFFRQPTGVNDGKQKETVPN